MKTRLIKVISALMATVLVTGIIFTGDIPQNNSVIQAVVFALGTIGTKNSNVSGEAKHIEAKAEKPAVKLKDILSKYDTGKPVYDKIDIKDDLKKVKDTYVISAKQFSEVTGDKYSFSSTGNGILIQHDGYSVALNPNDNIMVVNNDEYQYMPAPMTKVKNEYYFPVEDVAEGLGYSVTENKEDLTLSRDYQSKRILVKTEDKLTDTQNAVATAEVIDDVYALQYDSETKAEDACEHFKSLKSVDYAQPDAIVTAAGEEATAASAENNDSSGTYYSWGAQAMGVGDYTDYLKNNVGESNLKDVVIAVLDTGIDTDHPWFSGRIADGGANFSTSVSSTAYPYEDVYGHGTHVSGIISNLTMDNVKILPVKVMNDDGRGYTSTIVQGINYVTQQKQNGQNIYAINMSLGGPADSDSQSAFDYAINDAYAEGILTVVAAGNDGTDTCTSVPANIDRAITVAAVAQPSAYNFTHPIWSNYGSDIDLSAPGYEIESACVGGGTVLMSGTSMAAPHVAAAIALLYSDNQKTYTLMSIEDTLDYYSIDLGDPGWDMYYGAGMVNLSYAYAASMASVQFSKTTIDCTSAFDLTLSCTDAGSQIYYTVDGSSPSPSNGILYTGPIHINATVRIKAIAYIFSNIEVTKCSKISSMTYIFNGQDIPNAFSVSNAGELTAYSGVLTNVTVPSSLNGITVKSIGEYAFASMANSLLTVTLPSTVISINNNAFNGCRALTQVYAPSVTKIGMYAFCQCESFKYVQDLYFPELLTIGKYAFCNCFSLQPVLLSKVTYVDDYAFYMGVNTTVPYLTKVSFSSAKSLGYGCFFNCPKLTDLNIPSAEIICADAFSSDDLGDLYLPSVKYVGDRAFYVNKGITSVDMPEAIVIGESCFYAYCTLLERLNIPKVEKIGGMAFGLCSSLTELNLPSAKEVCYRAFNYCNNLKIVNAPKLQYVDELAFGHCVALEEVYLPSVVRISKDGFSVVEVYNNTVNLKKVTLSSCIEEISSTAFIHLTKSCVFYLYKDTVAEKYAISNGFTYVDLALGSNCFKYQKVNNSEIYITGYTDNLPDNAVIPSYIEGLPVTKVCSNAFENCTKVTVISLSHLKEIEHFAFSGCSNLKEIHLLKVETIGEKAFFDCTELSSVEIASVQAVGDYAFCGCSSLLTVELGFEINTIGTNAFGYSADNILIPNFRICGATGTAAEIYAKNHGILFSPNCSSLSSFYYNFYQNNDHQEIYISYVNKDVIGNITVPSSYNGYAISKIGDGAFSKCSFITNINLPATIKTIGYQSFDYCSSLETINCNAVVSLGGMAFAGCSELKNISLPSALVIGDGCFLYCSRLSYAYLPLATSIGDSAFEYCTNLISLYLFKAVSFSGNNIIDKDSSSQLTLYVHKNSAAEDYAAASNLKYAEVETILTAVNTTIIDNKNWLIYGLPPGVTSLNGNISIPEPCQLFYNKSGTNLGTGTVANVKLFDEVISSYTIVIFGDANGDGKIDASDANTCLDVQNGDISWDNATDNCYYKAADLNTDGNIDTMDADIICDITNGKISIDQASGKIILTPPSAVVINESMINRPVFTSGAAISEQNPAIYPAWANMVSEMGQTMFPTDTIATAASYISGDYTYEVTNATATITKYNGNGGTVSIPDMLGGYPVTCIRGNSMSGGAFTGCLYPTTIIIPDSVTAIDSYAFRKCLGLAKVIIGNGATTIGNYAFGDCSKLKTITLGTNVLSIAKNAFQNCKELISIKIPDKVVTIGDNSFSGCSKLTSVTIGRSVNNIGSYAFSNCIALAGISIPDSVKTISDYAFVGCTKLHDLTIGSGLNSMGMRTFVNCSALEHVVVDGSNSCYFSQDDVVFNKSKTTLVLYPCGKEGDYEIPEGIATIADNAFNSCAKLSSITIPKSVTSAGTDAFIACQALDRFIVSSENTAFSSQDDILFNKEKTALIQYPCHKAGDYVIPSTVIEIRRGAFYDCEKLAGVHIENGVTTIGDNAFTDCPGLISITLPSSVTSIGKQAFYFCQNLQRVYFTGNAPILGYDVFTACAPGFTIYYISDKTGFSNPWNNYTTTTFSPVSISLDTNGGSEAAAIVKTKNSLAAKPVDPTKAGFTFGGWYSDSGLINAVVWPFSLYNDVTFYAKWIPQNSFSITFDADGGTGGTSMLMNAGDTLTIPTVVKTGYTFTGWSPEVPATVPDGNSTFTAQWAVNSYTMSFEANGGTGSTSSLMEYGTGLTAPVIKRSGASFLYWSPSVPETVPAANTTFTAIWDDSYLITFDACGGSGGISSYKNAGDTLSAPTVSKTGYTFIGWSPALQETVPAANTTYTALWSPNQYTISFEASGGTGGSSNLMTFGTALTPPHITKAGYTFIGWSPEVPSTVPAADITYTAQWTVNYYTISFNGNGNTSGSTDNLRLSYNVSAALTPNGYMKTGNSFLGWSTEPEAVSAVYSDGQTVFNLTPNPSEVITFYAVWSANYYLITFDANGGTGGQGPTLMQFGTALSVPIVQREGYDFNGWSPQVTATVPAADTTYVAQWIESRYFQFTISNSKATITKFGGVGGAVTIPDTLGGCDVVAIGEYAFQDCTQITSLVMGSKLITIGDFAFMGCTGLTSITVGSNVKSIGNCAFSHCEALISFAIPDKVISIANNVLTSCYKLTNLTIGSGLTTIGPRAIGYCPNLARISVDSNNQYFSSHDDTLLNKSGTYLFRCVCLESGNFVVPDGVQYIGDYAFYMSKLTSVTFPESTISIDANAFTECYAINNFTVSSENKSLCSQDGIIFNKNKTQLIVCPINKSGEYVIPSTVTEICDYAFCYCKLASITIPNGVRTIGESAFYYCTDLSGSLIIPDSVIYIGSQAFINCCELSSLTLGNGLKYIGNLVFDGCEGLYSLTIGKNVTEIGYSAFCGCTNLIKLVLPDSLISIDDFAFLCCTKLTELTIPNSVKAIGVSSFGACQNLTKVFINNQLLNIGNTAFKSCPKLISAYFYGNAPTLGTDIFTGCASGFKVYYINGKTGFSNPWNGYATALWTANVTFDANGGSGGSGTAMTPGDALSAPTVTRDGYTFTGWSPSVPATVPTANTTYTAQWNAYKPVTVTFDAKGGTGGGNVPTAWGAKLTAPVVSKSGYTFAGWAPAVPSNVPDSNVTYTAQWTYDGTVNINLNVGWYNAGTGVFTPLKPGEALKAGDVLTVRISPENDFLTGASRYVVMFSKQYFSILGSGKAAFTPNQNNSFYSAVAPDYTGTTNIAESSWPATFGASENYTVYSAVAVNNLANSYSTNGGLPARLPGDWLFSFNLQVAKDIPAGSDARIWMDNRWVRSPGNTTDASYFTKCSDSQYSSLGDSVSYNYDVDMTDADITLPLPCSTIRFNSNDGSTIDAITGKSGDTISLPELPTKAGYIFTGWFSDEDLTAAVTWPYTLSATDVTFYAKWTLLGDINGDGGINVVDALMALHHVSGYRSLSDNQQPIADVDKNGVINIIDALKILQFSSGTITSFS